MVVIRNKKAYLTELRIQKQEHPKLPSFYLRMIVRDHLKLKGKRR